MIMKNNIASGGFTLVELAIVLMIIGLIIGGILRGQELLNNARVTADIRQAQSYEAAVTSFQDMYGALPGDITNPSARLPNCNSLPCSSAGNGDGILDLVCTIIDCQINPSFPGLEGRTFWVHLVAAHLITGINPNSTNTNVAWGVDYPAAPTGGGFVVTQFSVPAAPPYASYNGISLVLKNDLSSGMDTPALTPHEASQIDIKMDDGDPYSGQIVSTQDNAFLDAQGYVPCLSAAGNYNETTDAKGCALIIRIHD
jgi:prepilin-type N-terminal cleavage/methylation domain-containing protein